MLKSLYIFKTVILPYETHQVVLSFFSLYTSKQSSLLAFYCATAFETPSVQLQKMNTCLCGEKKLFYFFNVLEMLRHIKVNLEKKNLQDCMPFEIELPFLKERKKRKEAHVCCVLLFGIAALS